MNFFMRFFTLFTLAFAIGVRAAESPFIPEIDARFRELEAFVGLDAGAVDTAALADDAVTTDKILDAAVTSDKIDDDAVIEAKILDEAVTSAKLEDGGVATADLADAAVTGAKLGSQAATGLHASKIAVAVVPYTAMEAASNTTLDLNIPDNAVVLRAWYEVTTTFTSAGADAGTIGLGIEAAEDLAAANDIADVTNPWDAGFHESLVDGTTAAMIKIDGTADLILTRGAQALTAGSMRVYIEYVESI